MQDQLPEEEDVKNPLDAVKTIFTNFERGKIPEIISNSQKNKE